MEEERGQQAAGFDGIDFPLAFVVGQEVVGLLIVSVVILGTQTAVAARADVADTQTLLADFHTVVADTQTNVCDHHSCHTVIDRTEVEMITPEVDTTDT